MSRPVQNAPAAAAYLPRGQPPVAAARRAAAASGDSPAPRLRTGQHSSSSGPGLDGDSPLPPSMAAGSFLLSDEGESLANGGAAASIPSSQLYSQASAAAARLTRQRPRFLTVQDLDLALNQAIEGRINTKNAWASKEASDLLEGIAHTIESTLDAGGAMDDYSGFTKAATVVEGCSKVWTVRVDSTYHQSNQMLQRLLRNEDGSTSRGANDDDDDDDDGNSTNALGVDGENGAGGRGRKRGQRAAAAAAAAAAARTLALEAGEINLDSKARTALTQTGVAAQFRAITEKFDQGNAQGLLLSNAPLGALGNVILDVDYARLAGSEFSAKKTRQARQQQMVRAERRGADPDASDADDAEQHGHDGARASDGSSAQASPRPSLTCVERDLEVNATLNDLPDLADSSAAARISLGSVAQASARDGSGRASESSDSHRNRSGRNSGGGSDGGNDLGGLLALPHAAIKQELSATEAGGAAGASRRASVERPSSSSSPAGQEALPLHRGVVDGMDPYIADRSSNNNKNNNGDDDDDGGGGGADDWGDDAYDFSASAADGEPAHGDDVGARARGLVCGTSEMEAMHNFLGRSTREAKRDDLAADGTSAAAAEEEEEEGEVGPSVFTAQLALEAEDPTAWCRLPEVSGQPLAGQLLPPNSELWRIRRQHHVLTDASAKATDGGGAAKRARKERTVGFSLSSALSAVAVAEGSCNDTITAAAAATTTGGGGGGRVAAGKHGDAKKSALLSTGSLAATLLSVGDADGGALKQSTTATKNMTPLGREILLGKGAEQTALQYTQSGYQRACAERAGLVLPADPVPGETLPECLPLPVTMRSLFQPFCTPQPSWNMLNKSAAGGNLPASRGYARYRPRTGGDGDGDEKAIARAESDDDDDANGEEMPVAFFAGGAERDTIDDDDDAVDFGGPDDDDEQEERDRASYSQAELQLLQQFDAHQQRAVAAAAAAASDAVDAASSSLADSARSSGALGLPPQWASLLRADPAEAVARVLMSSEEVLPTQVDVVRLRGAMWTALQRMAGVADGVPGALGHSEAAVPPARAAAPRDGPLATAPRDGKGVLKRSALALLARAPTAETATPGAKRRRREGTPSAESTSSIDEEEEEEGKNGTNKRVHADEDEDDDSDSVVSHAEEAALRFSDLVGALLPQIPSVSSTGTLSPAFFFFSVLFLANEHNMVLKTLRSLDDLVVDKDSLVSAVTRERERGAAAARKDSRAVVRT